MGPQGYPSGLPCSHAESGMGQGQRPSHGSSKEWVWTAASAFLSERLWYPFVAYVPPCLPRASLAALLVQEVMA